MRKEKTIAIEVKLERDSQSSPGYRKYMVTLLEPSGDIKKVPTYGRDSQEALSRLNSLYLADKRARALEKIPMWVALVVFAFVMMVSAVASQATNNPAFLILAIVISSVVVYMMSRITNKQEEWKNLK